MTKNLYRNILLILALPAFFFACNDEDENIAFEVQADAYIVKKKMNDEMKYGIAYFAYGNKAIESATVTPPSGAGDAFSLEASQSSVYTYFKEPSADDYSATFPIEGQYVFDVESQDGEVIQQADLVQNGLLELPVITETTYHSDVQSLKVEWEAPDSADGHVVKLLNESGDIVFLSFTLTAVAEEYEINQASGNWNGSAYSGENYTVQVQAFTHESGVSQDDLLYNIQEIAIAEKQVAWGS